MIHNLLSSAVSRPKRSVMGICDYGRIWTPDVKFKFVDTRSSPLLLGASSLLTCCVRLECESLGTVLRTAP